MSSRHDWPGEKVLVAFVLSGSTHFMSMPTDKRIEVRFLFETFAHHKIDERTFLDLCHQYDTHLADRAELLVICVSHPYSVVNDASMWSEFETAMIIACYTYGTKDSVRKFFPNRDEAACRKKFLRVIDGLQRNNMFSDFPLPPLLNSVATQVDIPDNRDNSCALQHEIRYVKRAMHLKIATMQRCERKKQYILRAKIAAQQRKILKLEKYNADMDEEEPDADESDLPVTDQSKRLVFESIELLQAPVNGRGYSDFMLQIARLLCLTSPKCYRIIRQVLPLPCETTLWKHFGGEMRQTKEQLTVKERISERIRGLYPSHNPDPMVCTVGIDAFSFQTFSGQGTLTSQDHPSEYSNGFLFVCIPLSTQYKVRVLHIYPKENGSYCSDVDAVYNEVVAQLRAQGHQVWFKATDGDRFLSKEHEEFFSAQIENKGNFLALVNMMYDLLLTGVTMPVADPLHFGKNIRGKLLDHNVAVVRDGQYTNTSRLQESLKLGDVLSDSSLVGRMRDCYVTKLFTLENVCILMKKRDYSSALLCLPYACVYTVLYALNLTIEARQFLVNLAFCLFSGLLDEARHMVGEKTGVKYRYHKNAKAITIAEVGFFQRMMHTCVALGVTLAWGPTSCRLDAIGTHIVENMIGIARSVSNSPKYDAIISAFAKGETRKEIATDLGLNIYIPRRVNAEGTKIDSRFDVGIGRPSDWCPEDICSMLIEAARNFVDDESNGLVNFRRELRHFTDQIQLYEMNQPNSTANTSIVARNMQFCSKLERNQESRRVETGLH